MTGRPVQEARSWLAAFNGLPEDERGGFAAQAATHLQAVLDMVALQGRTPTEGGYDWLMHNVDAQVKSAIQAGNEHRHQEEDTSLRVAMVRATQAVAAATKDAAPAVLSDWDDNTAKEADAFQKLVMHGLGVSPGSFVRDSYPEVYVTDILDRLGRDEGADAEEICRALVEVGPWDDIDGDGTSTSLIVEHIGHLARMSRESTVLTELQVERITRDANEMHRAISILLAQVTEGSVLYQLADRLSTLVTDILDDLTGFVGSKCKHGEPLGEGMVAMVARRDETDENAFRATVLVDRIEPGLHGIQVVLHPKTA